MPKNKIKAKSFPNSNQAKAEILHGWTVSQKQGVDIL
jgi:hypothetical protein